MENQINAENQKTQQIGQNPISQPVLSPEKLKINYIMIAGIILVCFILFGFGGYYMGKTSFVKNTEPNSSPTQTVTPTSVDLFDPTAKWTAYKITPDSLLGYIGYAIKLPESWKQIEHSSNFQETETFKDDLRNNIYTLVIHQEKNYNSQTGKPYATLREATGLPYDVTAQTVDMQQAARVLPRAGSESDYKVIFFSKDNKLVFSIELDTPRDGSKVNEGGLLFNQILSTFKFINMNESQKKYTNSKLGFSFSYPSSLNYIHDYLNEFTEKGQLTGNLLIQNFADKGETQITNNDFQMVVWVNKADETSLEQIATGNGNKSYGRIMVSGISAIKGASVQKYQDVPTVWLKNNGVLYTFQLSTPKSINFDWFDQILLSFKFE